MQKLTTGQSTENKHGAVLSHKCDTDISITPSQRGSRTIKKEGVGRFYESELGEGQSRIEAGLLDRTSALMNSELWLPALDQASQQCIVEWEGLMICPSP